MRVLNKILDSYLVTLALIFLCALALGGSIRPWNSKHPALVYQSREKEIEKLVFNNEPFEFLDLKVKGVKVNSKEKFQADADWLQRVEFRLKNKSGKPIVYIHMVLAFPETKIAGPIRSYDIKFGLDPALGSNQGRRADPIFLIRDDVAVISIPEKQYTYIQSSLQREGFLIGNLTKVEIRIPDVRFADGTMWASGELFEPDLNNPSGWKKIKVPRPQ